MNFLSTESLPHSITCTMTLTTWRANLPSREVGHLDPRVPHSSNAPMNLRTPWRKKWRASSSIASASRRKRTPATWRRPLAPQLTNKLSSFSTPTAPRLEADNNQMASLAVDQLRVLSFLVAPSSLEGNAICACCSGRCHSIRIESAPQGDVDGKLRTLINWEPAGQDLYGTLVCGSHGHIHIAQLCVASHRGPGLCTGQGSFWSSCPHP